MSEPDKIIVIYLENQSTIPVILSENISLAPLHSNAI